MKKIILVLLISFTALLADYVITKDGTLTLQTTQSTTTPPPADEGTITATPPTDVWVGPALPTKVFNVLDYGLKGDGVTDDSAALKVLAKNTKVTNWYFPSGKTFRLYGIDVPAHIVAVYGPGKIISLTPDPLPENGYVKGAFFINTGHTNLVIDGLSFERETGYPSETNKGAYGHITFSSSGAQIGTEVRNCIFDSLLAYAVDVKFFGTKTNPSRDVRIYNNTFKNGGWFAIEIFGFYRDKTDDTGMENFHIYNNKIYGKADNGHGIGEGISFANVRKNLYAYNNTIENTNWGFEACCSNNIHIYENTVRGTNNSYNEGGKYGAGDEASRRPTGVNYVHHNHFEGTYLLIYGGSLSEIHDNYIKGRMLIQKREGDDARFGEIYNNTFVSAQWDNIRFEAMASGSFHDNDVYFEDTTDRSAITFMIDDGTSDIYFTNNNIYKANSQPDCISTESGNPIQANLSGNICKTGWTGISPTKRP